MLNHLHELLIKVFTVIILESRL